MKKTLLLVLSLLLIVGVALGLAGCKTKEPDTEPAKSYRLDSSAFEPTVVFGEKLSLNGLKLVEAGGETVTVTDSMVTGVDTSSAGAKTLTVSYNDQTFTVNYTVKFRIVFVINGVETEQLVVSSSEINVPTPPAITGQQFETWSVQIPTTLTSNLRIDAIYKTLDGSKQDVYTWTGNGLINLSGYATDSAKVNVTVTDADGNAIGSDAATVAVEGDKIKYSLLSDDSILILISGEGVMDKSWLVQKTAEPTASLANGEAIGVTVGDKNVTQKINISQTPVSFKYTATPGNANIEVGAAGGFVTVYPKDAKAGVTEITVKVTNSENELEFITLKQYVVVTPKSIAIANNATEYGIEDIWTIGRENAGGLQKLKVSVVGDVGDGFYDNITWTTGTGNGNVTVSKDGTISLADVSADPDVVSIKAVFSYKGIELASAPMKVRCVYTGVNVYNYNELWAETNSVNPRPIVLQGNIKEDFSATNYTSMQSTYDLKYYENLYGVGTTEFYNATQIKVLIQFKNDVYGNGYEINAHNATLGTLDGTGKPTDKSLFKGPLNFVAMAQTGGAISVKGQDNIVFGVYEGVTVNNIVLKSCNLTAVDGKVDLNDLEYAGTTVEVLGDNVTIEYSRLQNGRMVLRVFGDDNDATQKIHLEVKNSVLKGSREFTARIGSNRFEYNAETAAPLLPGDGGSDYETKKTYNGLSDDKKAAYDEKYINTFVTFENVVFEDAGIFSIGLDSHFAGEALKDGSRWFSGALVGWKDLAKTSYGAKITLKTDVRLYSWKPLNDIDSSTLMENTLSKEGTGDSNMFANMKFDVKALVKSAATTNAQYSNILFNYGGEDYVHAGIAFFGGGKNYSVVENKITSSFNHTFTEYNVKLSELVDDEGKNQGYLQTAAGNEPFYFLIYNKNSTFTYETQLGMTDKYSCLYN